MEISLIFVHYAMNPDRSYLARNSLESLWETTNHLPCELIVVDNGGSMEDSRFFLDWVEAKKVTHYVRNADNLWFGWARNQALRISTGQYICVADNDLEYTKGWLDKCLEVLKATKGNKLLVTPRCVIPSHRRHNYKRTIHGVEYMTNTLAGSNCWLMHREDYEKIGEFENHIVAGSRWCRHYSELRYSVVVVDPTVKNGLVLDHGQGEGKYYGYQKKGVPDFHIDKTLINGEIKCLN